jgi:hypothetical protein
MFLKTTDFCGSLTDFNFHLFSSLGMLHSKKFKQKSKKSKKKVLDMFFFTVWKVVSFYQY